MHFRKFVMSLNRETKRANHQVYTFHSFSSKINLSDLKMLQYFIHKSLSILAKLQFYLNDKKLDFILP